MTDEHSQTPRLPDDLDAVPPSATLIYHYLQQHGPCTHQQLIECLHTPGRTIRYGLDRLREEELLDERPSTDDARQTYYDVHG